MHRKWQGWVGMVGEDRFVGVGQGASSAYTEDRYLKVSPGKHVLELRLDGYETYSREIYVANSLLRIEAGLVRK